MRLFGARFGLFLYLGWVIPVITKRWVHRYAFSLLGRICVAQIASHNGLDASPLTYCRLGASTSCLSSVPICKSRPVLAIIWLDLATATPDLGDGQEVGSVGVVDPTGVDRVVSPTDCDLAWLRGLAHAYCRYQVAECVFSLSS
ncbi:hypothetical protein F4678DRAFT_160939 [Xylaria arbuscula]|nr:hypothetical protein F4678DRAFT_160939 [Xylaria arbuscula]